MIITISGTAGSGKSTIAKIIAERLHLKHYSTGDFMRQIAKERNLSLEDINRIAEGDRSIDTTLDKWQIELGKNEDEFIIDGRISFHFIPRSIKIFLDADIKIRAERIWKDIKIRGLRKEERADNLREIIEEVRKREASEVKRYEKYYQINPYEHQHYDFVVDTSKSDAQEAADDIIIFVQKIYKEAPSQEKHE
ncbi:MAG: (d)CMP kinase [Candidatus Woesearchaeota archaeon]